MSQVLLWKVIVVRLLVIAPGCFYSAFSRDNRPRTKIQWFILKSYRGVFEACDNILMVYKSQSHSSKFGLINYMNIKTLIFHPFGVWFFCKSLFSFTWIFLNDGKLISVFFFRKWSFSQYCTSNRYFVGITSSAKVLWPSWYKLRLYFLSYLFLFLMLKYKLWSIVIKQIRYLYLIIFFKHLWNINH